MLHRTGLDAKFVNWMMLCVSSMNYSVLVNGQIVGPISPKQGLRQRDPLSPYLFIICVEGLSAMIKQAEARGLLHGRRIGRYAPSVSPLLFADNSFFFFKATDMESRQMQSILMEY